MWNVCTCRDLFHLVPTKLRTSHTKLHVQNDNDKKVMRSPSSAPLSSTSRWYAILRTIYMIFCSKWNLHWYKLLWAYNLGCLCRGLVHLVLGNLAEAGRDFQAALDGNPTHAHYPHYRAVVHGRKVRRQAGALFLRRWGITWIDRHICKRTGHPDKHRDNVGFLTCYLDPWQNHEVILLHACLHFTVLFSAYITGRAEGCSEMESGSLSTEPNLLPCTVPPRTVSISTGRWIRYNPYIITKLQLCIQFRLY